MASGTFRIKTSTFEPREVLFSFLMPVCWRMRLQGDFKQQQVELLVSWRAWRHLFSAVWIQMKIFHLSSSAAPQTLISFSLSRSSASWRESERKAFVGSGNNYVFACCDDSDHKELIRLRLFYLFIYFFAQTNYFYGFFFNESDSFTRRKH